jgi:hypothetical protein
VDGRKQNGGKRPGSGRKPKADEDQAKALCIAAIEKKYGSIEKGLINLLESGETGLIKFVFEHAIGKPKENVDLGLTEDTVNIIMSRVADGR